MTALLWILGLTLGTSFLCSILEAVLLSITHAYIAVLRERGSWAGRWLEEAQRNITEPIAAILTLNTIAHTMGATMAGAVALEVFGSRWVAAFSAGLTFAVLIFSEIVPKTLGATYWKKLAVPAAFILRAMVVLMKPILLPFGLISRFLARGGERPTVSRSEIEVLAEIGRREGQLDEDEWQVVSNVIRLDEVSVGEVMTPRTDMVAVPIDATVEDAKGVMLDEGHLRLPVFEGNLDSIAGVLLARDLWRADREGVTHIRDLVRAAPFAPATKPVEDLIPEMRAQRTRMAIVVDKFGGTAGLVTLEDLIEEIIGEIQDEHEADEPVDFSELPGGRLRIWGGASLREATERLELSPTDEEMERFDTVGGLVFGRLNRVPAVGDQVASAAGSFRVTRMKGRRVEYVDFTPATQAEA